MKVIRIAGACSGALRLLALLAAPAAAVSAVAADPAYTSMAAALERFIEHELDDKRLSGLSIALVDDQRVVWARGFGFADPAQAAPATADTVYRVGSVSKLFTDIAIMQLVERGRVELDAPIGRYLPDLEPKNPFAQPVTLRLLMAHKSGLVREPPVGNYFDTGAPSLEDTVLSLNGTTLVHPPGERTKYSNAGIAVVGLVLERLAGAPFASALERAVLEPLGLASSSFAPEPELLERLARGVMWSYDGRAFEAPRFELGMAPAGSMYSTVLDLSRFLAVLFRRGEISPGARLLRADSLGEMMRPQLAPPGQRTGYGLGFGIADLDGHRLLGHGGAIYGFATQLSFLPDERLGAVVAINVDVSNAVARRVALAALRLMLAQRDGTPLPEVEAAALEVTAPVDPILASLLDGRYERLGADGARAAAEPVELVERDGGLYLLAGRELARLRRAGDRLLVDDRHAYGRSVRVLGPSDLEIDGAVWQRAPRPTPAAAPPVLLGLLGEYGWDHNVLFVFEQDGHLNVLVEWIEIAPLHQVAPDVWAFPEQDGLYPGERIVFERGEAGRAIRAVMAGVSFPRRTLAGEGTDVFSIDPLRPVEELRREALAASPPEEAGTFRRSDLVELVTLDEGIRLDVRYATERNFMRTPFYTQPRAFLQRPAAAALVRAHRSLHAAGYGLLVHDAYRPWYVTKMFWEATPPDKRAFVADPAQGSKHNRGCAVDLTLYELRSGAPVEMVGLYDEMSERSYPDYFGGTAEQRYLRELLRDAMEAEGFLAIENEWWHFDYRDWRSYRIGTQRFEELTVKGAQP